MFMLLDAAQWRVAIRTNLCKVRYMTIITNILLSNGGHFLFSKFPGMSQLVEPVVQATPIPVGTSTTDIHSV